MKDDEASLSCGCEDKDGDGYSTCDGDCDDSNTSEGFDTNPNMPEKCGNGRNDDCNNATGDNDRQVCCDDTDADNDDVSVCDGDCDDTYAGIQTGCDPCAAQHGGTAALLAEIERCQSLQSERWQPDPVCRCTDRDPSPILIDLAGNNFSLTNLAGGVRFDLDGDGRITSGRELFGTYTEQPAGGRPNGFLALRLLDADGDGRVTAADPRFADLRLWVDADHDGVSRPEELRTLASGGVSSVGTAYKEVRRKDRYGNEFRYKGEAVLSGRRRNVYDVLLTAP